ncbi:hypothetical protein FOMA001_g18908 [Fusarium oxysporum f. sp. matthiolae]|nr:hypothetical protein FOMA001_g18908 [Fusarium oxysporum f. sp. matthiolae]
MAIFILVFLTSVAALLFHKLLISKLYPKLLDGLPHNRVSANRIFGDVSDVVAYTSKTQEQSEALFLINRKADSPIAQFLTPSISNSSVLIDDPREAEDILKRRSREFDRSGTTARFFKYLLPQCSIVQYTTPSLKAQKRLWADSMSTKFLRRVVAPNVHRTASCLIELWRLKAKQSEENIFETKKDFHDAAMDIMWAAILGSELGILKDQMTALEKFPGSDADHRDKSGVEAAAPREAAETSRVMFLDTMEFIDDTVGAFTKSGMASLRLKLIKLTPRYRRVQRTMDAELRRLMSSSRNRFQKLLENDVDGEEYEICAMDLVLRRDLVAAMKEGRVVHDDVKQGRAMLKELMLLLMAGIDSTGNTLAWCVKFLSLYPTVQFELRAALQSTFSIQGSALSPGHIIDTNIPYLDAFLQETLRFAVTAGAIIRRATVDTQILGYPIPAGTDIIMNTRVFRRPIPISEELRSVSSQDAHRKRPRGEIEGESGENLETFEPRRWLYDDGSEKEAFDPDALPTLVFGGGLRGCFGRRLAMQDLRIFVVLLVLNFEFLPLPGELRDLTGEEAVFRHPKQAMVKLKII